ncbi:putative ribonuclease H-like domain-containing protein [Tanacetum coccineum]|uniref:Ribonuclease H-like domain-containing protein n=1 Tax=Tanacetum coccineum TaxID=301880 RepID=A0ABQ5HQM4_9ASTR
MQRNQLVLIKPKSNATIAIRGYFARECRTKGNQDSRRRNAWNSGNKDGRRYGKQEGSKALVTIDGEGVDWTSHSEEEEDYALMACNSSGSNTEREQLSDASIEIKTYTQGLKKVEAQLVAHQQGQLCMSTLRLVLCSDALIIESMNHDSEDEYVSIQQKNREHPISAVGGKRETAVKPLAMTGNRAYLAELSRDFNGALLAFGELKGPPEANQNAGTKDIINAGDSEKEDESAQDYFVLLIWSFYSSTIKRSRAEDTAEALRKEFAQETKNLLIQVGAAKARIYQMDVKSVFLYGKIDEEVLCLQPPCFIDPNMEYIRGTIDKTLFIKKDKHDIILVQVYVDDIIFSSTKKTWCDEFEALMKGRFQMSSMGELTFFLGLQVKQKADGIFISQDKYVTEILKKFDFVNVKTASTPIETQKPLVKDEEASDVDVHLYRSMIGSLMYLTASRLDICLLSVLILDSDYTGANLDRKSTIGGCQLLGRRLISWQCKKQTIVATSTTEAEYVVAASCCGQFDSAELVPMARVSTDKEKDSTDRTDEGTDDQTEGGRATQTTQTHTSTIFGDDETIAQVLLNMSQTKAVSREKEKGVEFKDIEETERPRPTSTRSLLTLKPLPKIDSKDKGKKKIEEEDESESESDGIPEAEKKFKQLASDEEMDRKVQEEWEGKEERKRLAEEEATNDALIRNYDDIKAD